MQRASLALPLLLLTACKDPPAPAPRRPRVLDASSPSDHTGALATVNGDTSTDREIRQLQDIARRNPTRSRPLLRLAQLLVRKARESSDPSFYPMADDAAQRALRLDANDLAALQIRGLVLMQDHRFAEARELAQQGIRRDPQQPIFYGLLGDAEMEVGRYTEAEAAYQRMVDLRPNLGSYSRASWMRWLIGDAEGAIDAGRRAVEAGSPRVPEELAWTMVQLGNLYFATGDLDRAEQHYAAALTTFANYPVALDGRGLVKRARGDLAGAIEDFNAAVAGSTTTEILVHLGEAQEAAGRADDANATYVRAERAGRRSDPRALALFYASHDREHEAAVSLARRELEQRPADVYTQDVLAWALFRAGQLDEAARLITEARRSHTPEARFAFHAGMIAHAKGERDAAVTALREALELNPCFDPRGADEARRTLAALGVDAGPPLRPTPAAPRGDAGATAATRDR